MGGALTGVRAMVLAAGYGTRLGPLTQRLPKPMLPVCGAPLVEWAVRWLAHHGVHDVVVNLHHLGETIEAALGDGSRLGAAVTYSPEHGMILGTGGGLRQARRWLDAGDDAPIVIVNGKILIDLDLRQVIAEHLARGAEATMVLREDPDASRWGSLRVDAGGRVVEFLGRGDAIGPALMFTGVHVVQPRFLDRIPPDGEQCVVRTAYRSLFDARGDYYGHVTPRYWWEHSTAARYVQGVANVLDGRVPLPYAPGPIAGVSPDATIDADATVTAPVWIGPGARVEAGARIGPHVQLGAGASVASGVTLSRAIVWDGGRATADVRDAVLTETGADPVPAL